MLQPTIYLPSRPMKRDQASTFALPGTWACMCLKRWPFRRSLQGEDG